MNLLSSLFMLPLVDWTMGAVLLGVFLLVCAIMVAVIMNMVNGDKKKEEEMR